MDLNLKLVRLQNYLTLVEKNLEIKFLQRHCDDDANNGGHFDLLGRRIKCVDQINSQSKTGLSNSFFRRNLFFNSNIKELHRYEQSRSQDFAKRGGLFGSLSQP